MTALYTDGALAQPLVLFLSWQIAILYSPSEELVLHLLVAPADGTETVEHRDASLSRGDTGTHLFHAGFFFHSSLVHSNTSQNSECKAESEGLEREPIKCTTHPNPRDRAPSLADPHPEEAEARRE